MVTYQVQSKAKPTRRPGTFNYQHQVPSTKSQAYKETRYFSCLIRYFPTSKPSTDQVPVSKYHKAGTKHKRGPGTFPQSFLGSICFVSKAEYTKSNNRFPSTLYYKYLIYKYTRKLGTSNPNEPAVYVSHKKFLLFTIYIIQSRLGSGEQKRKNNFLNLDKEAPSMLYTHGGYLKNKGGHYCIEYMLHSTDTGYSTQQIPI